MRRNYYIDLVEEHSNVNFYSIHLESEELSEFERFLINSLLEVNMTKILMSSYLGLTILPNEVPWNAISVPKGIMATV